MSIKSLIRHAFDAAQASGNLLILEIGLRSGRSATVIVDKLEPKLLSGRLVSPSLTDRWLSDTQEFRSGSVCSAMHIRIASIDAVICREVAKEKVVAVDGPYRPLS